MTVASETMKIRYSCDGSQTVFPYTFQIYQDADLEVILVDSAGVETVLTLNSDYTVSGAGAASGGNVTTASTYSSDYDLLIRRGLDLLQAEDYVAHGPFPAESTEQGLDRLTMITQQLAEELSRAPAVAKSSVLTNLVLPVSASRILGWDPAGAALTTYPTTPVYSTDFDTIQNYNNDLAQMVTDIGAGKKTVFIDVSPNALTANLTIPSNIELVPLQGAVIDGAYTLTINGPFAGSDGCFGSSITVVFGTKVKAIFPEWWGAIPDGSTDCLTAFQKALASLPTTIATRTYKVGIPVVCGPGIYALSDTLIFPSRDYITLLGTKGGTWIKGPAGKPAIQTGNGTDIQWWQTIEGIYFTGPADHTMGTPVTASTIGILSLKTRQSVIRQCGFFNLAEGIRWNDGNQTLIDKCVFYYNNVAISAEQWLAQNAGGDHLWIKHCTMADLEYGALVLTGLVQEHTVEDCYIGSYGYSDNNAIAIKIASCAQYSGTTYAAQGISLKKLRFEDSQGSATYAIGIDDYNSLNGAYTWNYFAHEIIFENVRLISNAKNGIYLDQCIGPIVKNLTSQQDPASYATLNIGSHCNAADAQIIWISATDPNPSSNVVVDSSNGTNRVEIVDKQSGDVFDFMGSVATPPKFKTTRKTGIWDFSVDGGAVGVYTIGYIPNNAIVFRAWYEVESAPTSGGAANLRSGILTDGGAQFIAFTAYNDAKFSVGMHDCIPDGAAANMTTKTTNKRGVYLEIVTAALTGGKIRFWWDYIVGD